MLFACPLLLGYIYYSGEPTPVKQGIKVIVIDPGHGGKDPGCKGHSVKEKEIVLAISKRFGEKVKAAFPSVKVIYTRTTDKFVPLDERADIANRNKADLFISIHCNSHRSSVSGAEIYVMGLESAPENLSVAKRENSSILLEEDYESKYYGYDPNSNEGHIWLNMVQNSNIDESIVLADKIAIEFKRTAKRVNRGIKQAGFVVLRLTTMPSVLVEAGFLTNSSEEKFLTSSAGKDKMAQALYNAFNRYKKEVEGDHYIPPITENVKINAQPSAFPKPAQPTTETFGKIGKELEIMVQLVSSPEQEDTSKPSWKKVQKLKMLKEGGMYKYLVYGYESVNEAKNAQLFWRSMGFSGAFAVAYHNGKRITLEEANQILK